MNRSTSIDQFPTPEQVARYALFCLGVSGCRHPLMQQPDVLLLELGRRLVDRTHSYGETRRWLSDQGVELANSSYYRFVATWRQACTIAWHELHDPGAVRDPDVYTISELAERLRVKRSSVVDLVERGELEAIRLGRTIRVPSAAYRSLLATRKPARKVASNRVQTAAEERLTFGE